MLDGNACLCTNMINEKEITFEECNRPCTENLMEFCGGEYAQSYYDTDIKVPGPPRNVRAINRSDSSILVEWSAPEQTNYLNQYIIRANLIKKYGMTILTPSLQWTVEKFGHIIQYELLSLNPGICTLRHIIFGSLRCGSLQDKRKQDYRQFFLNG